MNKGVKHGNSSKDIELQACFNRIAGRFEAQLENFAHALSIPVDILTRGVVALLQPERERREDTMPPLRRSTTQERPAARQVEVASYARSSKTPGRVKRKSSPAFRKSISAFWAKMTPEERSKEMRRRRQVTLARKQAA